jgi:hypothetical protein
MDLQLKARVRAELFRCAVAGEFPTYAEFFERINPGATMGLFPYTPHFDQIAMDERFHNYPDITFVVRGADGHPHQIDFRDARNPDDEQIDHLIRGTDDILRLYCRKPEIQNPYLHLRQRQARN